MLDWLKEFIIECAKKFGNLVKDAFLWLWEWLYLFVSEFLSWCLSIVEEPVLEALGAIGGHMPAGAMDKVTGLFVWLQYINDWIPIKYAINLFVAYYGIKLVMVIIRWLLKLIPGMGG